MTFTRSNIALVLVFAIAALFLFAFLFPFAIDFIDDISNRNNGSLNLVIIVVAPLALTGFLYILLTGRPFLALLIFIVALPVLGRAERVGGIATFRPDGIITEPQHFLSASTLGVALFIVVYVFRRAGQKHERLYRHSFSLDTIDKAIITFGIVGTASQLFNHAPVDAILLSIGSIWQFIGFYFIIKAAVLTKSDVRAIVVATVLAMVLVGALRGISSGVFLPLGPALSNPNFRTAGGFLFGSPIYHGTYFSFALLLSVSLIRTSPRAVQRLAWTGVAAYLLLELIANGSRGPLISLVALLFVVRWGAYRQSFAIAAVAILLLFPIWQPLTQRYSGSRQIHFDGRVLELPNVMGRVELIKANLPHTFDNFGLGLGIEKDLTFVVSNAPWPQPNFVGFSRMTQQVGFLATLAFLYAMVLIFIGLLKNGRSSNNFQINAGLFIALLAWVFMANTSGAGNWMTPAPYEGSFLFFAILAAASRTILLDRGFISR